jgi:hypothetical protein
MFMLSCLKFKLSSMHIVLLDKNGNRVYPAEENCEVEAMPSELPSNVFRLKTARGE